MSRGTRTVGRRRGLAWLAAGQALAQDELDARVKAAQDAARANAASAQGRAWKEQHSAAAGRMLIPILNQCLPDPPGDVPTVFSVFVRLARAGDAREIVTELDATLGKCMTDAARGKPFPAAPREDYWIQVNMAAPL